MIKLGQVDVARQRVAVGSVDDNRVGVLADQLVIGGVIHDIQVQLNADLFPLLLNHLHRRQIDVGIGNVHARFKAVGISGLRQQIFGLDRVVFIVHHIVGMTDVSGRQGAGLRFGHIFAQVIDNFFPADCVTQGLTDFDVIEGRLCQIEMQDEHVGRRRQIDIESGLAEPVDPFLFGRDVDGVDFAVSQCQLAGGVVRQKGHDHRLQFRLAAPVVRIGLQREAFPGLVAAELKGARPDGVICQVLAHFFGGFFADNVAGLVIHQQRRQIGDHVIGFDLNGVRIDHGDTLDGSQVLAKR